MATPIRQLAAANIFPGDMLFKISGSPPRPGGLLRLRRDLLHDGVQLPPDPATALP